MYLPKIVEKIYFFFKAQNKNARVLLLQSYIICNYIYCPTISCSLWKLPSIP